jgi:hypothetical protein
MIRVSAIMAEGNKLRLILTLTSHAERQLVTKRDQLTFWNLQNIYDSHVIPCQLRDSRFVFKMSY